MKISLAELRQFIKEAVADHMRLPKGPNSRDDADDRLLTDEEPVTGDKSKT